MERRKHGRISLSSAAMCADEAYKLISGKSLIQPGENGGIAKQDVRAAPGSGPPEYA